MTISLHRTIYVFALVLFVLAGAGFGALSGSHDIAGGNNNYATFTAAVAALTSESVSGPVTFNGYGRDYRDYNEAISMGAFAGAREAKRVTFLDASGTARIP